MNIKSVLTMDSTLRGASN